jgi:HSP20 family molecular chaperone IbpA
MTVAAWAPSVDILEDEGWLIKADLPEVRKEDVNVTVENGVLTLTGERKFEGGKGQEVSPRGAAYVTLSAVSRCPMERTAAKFPPSSRRSLESAPAKE